MRTHDGRRHELRRFVTRVAEHQSLIAGALFCGVLTFNCTGVHALCNIGRLFSDDVGYGNFVGVKDIVVIYVTDIADRVSHELFDMQHTRQRLIFGEARDSDLAAYEYHVALGEGFASYATTSVLFHARVEHGV